MKKAAPKKVKPEKSGRQPLYGSDKVKRIMISIPASKETEVKEKINALLQAYAPNYC